MNLLYYRHYFIYWLLSLDLLKFNETRHWFFQSYRCLLRRWRYKKPPRRHLILLLSSTDHICILKKKKKKKDRRRRSKREQNTKSREGNRQGSKDNHQLLRLKLDPVQYTYSSACARCSMYVVPSPTTWESCGDPWFSLSTQYKGAIIYICNSRILAF